MDLTPYTCRGFPGDFDRLMRDVPVAGIDRQQTHAMIRLCDETEPILYGADFSPRRIRYRAGSRPQLESVVAACNEKAAPTKRTWALGYTRRNVRHPNFAGVDLPPDRALSEEDLIGSGIGWCNEQCRVYIALCQVMEIPARLCYLFHANGRTGHTACEVFVHDRWEFHDVTFGVGAFREAREIWRDPALRRTMDEIYADVLPAYYQGKTPPFDLSQGGDFFDAIGICNYLIEGVEAIP